jgi:hypothetical protein
MLSGTYTQQSDPRPEGLARDPQNRLLWRFNRQRLDFESMRDSALAVAGTLDLTRGGPSVNIGEPPFPPRRTVYGFIDRQNLDGVYRTFDFAVPDATSPKRFVTTVPQQALYLMNSPFIQEQAKRLAATLEREASQRSVSWECEAPAEPSIQGSRQEKPSIARQEPRPPTKEELVCRLYRRIFAREPATRELAIGAAFLRQQEHRAEPLPPLAQLAQVLIISNEFMFVD